jgi:hypothetical protein
VILGVLLLVGAFVIWKQFLSTPEPPVIPAGKVKPDVKARQAAKAKAARKAKTGGGSGSESGNGTRSRSADSLAATGRGNAAGEGGKAGSGGADDPVARWKVREEEAGDGPLDPEAYSFARVAWDSPESGALQARVRRLEEGFDRRPVGRFSAVEGRETFLRVSVPVNHAPDRKLSRIPESAVAEYLPEWYQRGFTLHFRGHREPFSPRTFRLREIPGSRPPPEEGQDRLVNYAVYADVEAADALLIYPHDGQGRGEGANGFVSAGELTVPPPEAPFGADYFRRLTGGRVDSLRAYALADRGFLVVEAHARRKTWLFLVKPGERGIAFLVHGFDARPCRKGKDIRFLGVLDVDGDETPELLLGPHPAFLVHEDAGGIKYHYAAGSACAE